ncbi:haloacid dehalogenase [Pedobacter sp.]
MMKSFDKYLKAKKALIITLDDAIYPEKDYLLQVYYLFSEFMAYTEQFDAKLLLDFMKTEFDRSGAQAIFKKTAVKFGIEDKYEHNFDLLHETARLPLKLLMFQNVLSLLQEVVKEGKEIILLADGDPNIAINKIKQLEWHGLEQNLKVYFISEYDFSLDKTISAILVSKDIDPQEVTLILSENQFVQKNVNINADCFSVTEIL